MIEVETESPAGLIPAQGAPGGTTLLSLSDNKFLGLLQQITRCGNDWRPYLVKLGATPSATTQAACLEVFGQIQIRVAQYFDQAKDVADKDVVLFRWWGDELSHIETQWEILTAAVTALTTSGQIDDGTKAKAWLTVVDESGYSAARLTIPARIRDTLGNVAVGDSINFDDQFQDETPDSSYRKKFIQELYDQILLVPGYVDTSNDTITKIAASGTRLWQPIAVTVLLLVAAEAAIYGCLRWSGAPGLQPVGHRPTTAILLADLGLIWLGMFAHIALAWYKGFRQNGTQVPRSVTRILYLVSAREMAIWAAVIVGAVLGYAFVLTGHVSEAGAVFAIGYSADSLVDTLVPRFNTSLLQIAKALPAL